MTVPDPEYDLEAATERGFLGFEVDPTPNENYSLQTPPDAPTPETDDAAKTEAKGRAEELRQRLSGVEAGTAAPKKASRSSGSSSSSSSSGGE